MLRKEHLKEYLKKLLMMIASQIECGNQKHDEQMSFAIFKGLLIIAKFYKATCKGGSSILRQKTSQVIQGYHNYSFVSS